MTSENLELFRSVDIKSCVNEALSSQQTGTQISQHQFMSINRHFFYTFRYVKKKLFSFQKNLRVFWIMEISHGLHTILPLELFP
jgi:hypothetical protein